MAIVVTTVFAAIAVAVEGRETVVVFYPFAVVTGCITDTRGGLCGHGDDTSSELTLARLLAGPMFEVHIAQLFFDLHRAEGCVAVRCRPHAPVFLCHPMYEEALEASLGIGLSHEFELITQEASVLDVGGWVLSGARLVVPNYLVLARTVLLVTMLCVDISSFYVLYPFALSPEPTSCLCTERDTVFLQSHSAWRSLPSAVSAVVAGRSVLGYL